MWSWLFERFHGCFPFQGPQTALEESIVSPSSKKTTVLYARVNLPAPAETATSADSDTNAIGSEETRHSLASEPIADAIKDLGRNGNGKRRPSRSARFARLFSDMKPREARLLFCIHRRRLAHLASESPAALQRDLQRFFLSTAGQNMSRDCHVPTLARVRQWVTEAKARLSNSNENFQYRPVKIAR